MSDESRTPIRIDTSDLYAPRVNEIVEMQQALRRDTGPIDPQPLLVRIIYSSWFYLAIASGFGALLGWALLEPFFDERTIAHGRGFSLVNFLVFPVVAGAIGLFLGAAEGIMCRNPSRAFLCGLVGLGVGFGGGLIALVPASLIFGIMVGIAVQFWDNPLRNHTPTGFALLVLMMGRAAAWAVAAIPAGLGQGLALKEKRVILNGIVGGVMGGLVGGILFDPISVLFHDTHRATISRGVGFVIIGLFVGLFVGLVEGWTKTAWLLMRAGPLAGKQFVLFRDTTVLGSSPKAEVYLFKDEAIEPRHALIYNRGGRFEIEDCNTRDGTYVNGVPVRRQGINHGDQVVLGKTVLEFQLKETRPT
ncbi:MAG: FHA domain-containing protein [Thermoguttaceae bacterium]